MPDGCTQTQLEEDGLECWINRARFATSDVKEHMTGAQIRALPMPSIRDTDDLYMEVPGSEDLIVQYDEVVPVSGRRFFSVPSIINAGSPDAAKGQGCSVVVFTGMNVSVGKMRGFTCAECGADIADHRVEASKLVPLDKAYAMNTAKAMGQVSFGV